MQDWRNIRRDSAEAFGGQKEQQNGGEPKTINIQHRAHGKQEGSSCSPIPAGTATLVMEAWVKEDDPSMWHRHHEASEHSH